MNDAKPVLRQPRFYEYFNYLFMRNNSDQIFAPFLRMIPVLEANSEIAQDPVYQNKDYVPVYLQNVLSYSERCRNARRLLPTINCGSFFNCWDGFGMEQHCPAGLLFTYVQQRCDFPHLVYCGNRQLRNPGALGCGIDYETFRNPLACNEFFVCANMNPIKFQCSADLSYNEDLGVCDYTNRVNCSISSRAEGFKNNSDFYLKDFGKIEEIIIYDTSMSRDDAIQRLKMSKL